MYILAQNILRTFLFSLVVTEVIVLNQLPKTCLVLACPD
jgi:hypothetical protein